MLLFVIGVIGFIYSMIRLIKNKDSKRKPAMLMWIFLILVIVGSVCIFQNKDDKIANNRNEEVQESNIIETYELNNVEKEVLDAESNERLQEQINIIKDNSNDVVINIIPMLNKSDWSIVKVIISDDWYRTPKYEQERFVEQMSAIVKNVIKDSKKVDRDKNISVYFYDLYNKKIASPKITGGYKILD